LAVALLAARPGAGAAQGPAPATIAQIKPSIVAVGSFERTRNPAFSFAGTGFIVGDGLRVATNEHVLPKALNSERNEILAIALRLADGSLQIRPARKIAADPSHDLALLELQGAPLPALRLGDSGRVREGEAYLFTGYPIGAVLGLYPVTHRTMIAALTPIVIPAAGADKLDARAARRLSEGAFPVFQLDGTAYPGNSGSPVYDPASGEVIGIVNSVFVKGTKESALTQPSGITYAIPIQAFKDLLERTR
jgi:S1-C subfamily serine protease